MASYNTFLSISTTGRPVLVTSSARKAYQTLRVGVRVEVWSGNRKTETVYTRSRHLLDPYIEAERVYIRTKQEAAERRNKQRRQRYEKHTGRP